MLKDSDWLQLRRRLREPRVALRLIIGLLLAANLVAVWAVMRPPGGSAEQLEEQIAQVSAEIQQRRTTVERLKQRLEQVEKARAASEAFLNTYFLNRRMAYSTIVAELMRAAKESGIRPKEHAIQSEAIEGSDNLSMMTITANYEGTYRDLLEFVNRIDRSPKFLIIEQLVAAPQQSGGLLSVSVKLHAFVRESAAGSAPLPSGGDVPLERTGL
jgi:type IV pilus assembly protein PilO